MSRAFKGTRQVRYSNWSVEQLRERISYCENMEKNAKFNKARRSWKEARQKVELELERRAEHDNTEN